MQRLPNRFRIISLLLILVIFSSATLLLAKEEKAPIYLTREEAMALAAKDPDSLQGLEASLDSLLEDYNRVKAISDGLSQL